MGRVVRKSLLFAGSLLLTILLLPSCATTELHSTPPLQSYQGDGEQHPRSVEKRGLRVMTLNLAHGRGTGFHQMLQYSEDTLVNLDRIVILLDETEPDIIALQEADAPSFWSGKFNHVEYLASHSIFTHSVQASHVDAIGLSYGTALMSRLALSNPQAVTFDPSNSPMPKGFVVSTINWPGTQDIAVDVVSVHLDFVSGTVRKKQLDELIAVLRKRNNRVIVMGDLNSGWHRQDSAAHYLASELGLTAYQPENRELVTFPALGERLDWILVSPGLEFQSHEIVGAGVSDHRGVIAELTLSGRQAVAAGARNNDL